MLQKLYEADSGFDFRLFTADKTNEITGLVLQTGQMRRRLMDFGDVIFVDATEQTNTVNLTLSFVDKVILGWFFVGHSKLIGAIMLSASENGAQGKFGKLLNKFFVW